MKAGRSRASALVILVVSVAWMAELASAGVLPPPKPPAPKPSGTKPAISASVV